jgi:transcriptional/translational regulatory protein YebC/TACO1
MPIGKKAFDYFKKKSYPLKADYYQLFEDVSFDNVKKAVEKTGMHIEAADIEWVAQNPLPLTDEQSNTALEFLSTIQDHDDVQNVYTNAEFSDTSFIIALSMPTAEASTPAPT